MEKPRVVLLIYHGKGHFNACFQIGKILQQHYDVVFSGYAYFTKYIEDQGFKFFPLKTVPFGLGFERWLNETEKSKNIFWKVITDHWKERLYLLREKELTAMMHTLKPTHLLIDSWQSTDFIVLYPLLKNSPIKLGFVQTMLSTIVHPNYPPLNTNIPPDNALAVAKAQAGFKRNKLRTVVIDKLKHFGFNKEAQVSRRILTNKIPKKYLSTLPSIFSINFEGIDEFILSSAEFEYPNYKPLSHQRFVGAMIDKTRLEFSNLLYDKFEADFLKTKSKRPVIYCSFGSTALEDVSQIQKLLTFLNKIITRNNFIGLVSSGSSRILELSKNFPGIHFFEQVPQVKMLRHASIFITHGGLNSIKEAIYSETPMLVFPVTKNSDLQGNAARVAYHKIGLVTDPAKETERQIETKMQDLLSNPAFVENIKQFKSYEDNYSTEKFLHLFDQLKSID
jgi:UDP:flavonoid glycosyltransferase YjiC (YdhE family)